MKRSGKFDDREDGSLVELIIVTLMLIIGCVVIGTIIFSAITHQARGANQHTTCIVNVNDGACVR